MKRVVIHSLLICCIFSSCVKQPHDGHLYLSFTNTSNNIVYVTDYYWIWSDIMNDPGFRIDHPFHLSEEAHSVVSKTTRKLNIIAYYLTYEKIFTYTDKYTVYVFSRYLDPGDNKNFKECILVRYELTLEDLVSLDFHLYYPPNEKMKYVKMNPPYETFEN